jgi:epoxyqueuosine reductase
VAESNILESEIKTEAKRLGFSLFGITRPDPPPHWPVYAAWIAANHQAGMGYLASEPGYSRRSSPNQVLPDCRAIIVLGIPYANPGLYPGQLSSGEGPTLGRVAAYAWGNDYHLVIPPRLRALAEFINHVSGAAVTWRGYTDTGPILERDLAQRAGLGWIGKNSCLIHPHLGSYFLLAELFLDLALESTPPFAADRCGKCTRCITTCPTGCILPDRTLDAGRCLSYLTIEHKGPIPLEMRPHIKEWVFGCDICQMVCPYNRWTASQPGDPAFDPRPDVPLPDLRCELKLTPQEFNIRFRGSPVQRPHRRGYLRNIALALGNSGDLNAIPDLAGTLAADSEPVVRGAAAWALRRLDTNEAVQTLQNALTHETDENVRKEIFLALNPKGLGDPSGLNILPSSF